MSIDIEVRRAASPAAQRRPLATRGPAERIGRFLNEHQVPIYGFLASRLALLAVGLMTQVFIRPITTQGNTLQLSPRQALNIWGAWDSGWYAGLATSGYSATAGADGTANWAFFPAYPGIAAALARLTHMSVFEAMLLVSNVSFFIALVLVHRLARAEFDKRTADGAAVLLCLTPGSYIFSSAYTESLFLAAIAGCLILMRSRRWLAAGLVGGLAVLTRNVGVGLLLPFAWTGGLRLWELLQARRREHGRWAALVREGGRVAAGALIPLAALAGFCVLLHLKTGDALAFVHVQKAWGRSIGNPLAAPLTGLLHPGTVAEGNLLSFVAAWVSLALVVVLGLMRRWPLFWLALFMTLVPLATGLGSYARYMLVIAPLWLAAAKVLTSRPIAFMSAAIVLATVNGFMMVAWTLSLWVTT